MAGQLSNPAADALRLYATAVFGKDLDAFMSLYSRDVFIFDAWDVRSYEGADAWRRTTSDWFSSLGNERVVVEFEDERAGGSATLAYASAIVRYTAVSAAGESLRSLQNRITVVLELRDGE